MALELIIDVAEIDDLGFRVVAEEPRAHGARETTLSSRAFRLWGLALVAITAFGLVGRFLEPGAAPTVPASNSAEMATNPGAGWPSTGHSEFRYPATTSTTVTLRFERVPGLDGSVARLEVSGRVEGPIGNVAVQLMNGSDMLDEVTRYYAPMGGTPPAPYGAFDLTFAVPNGEDLSNLWIVARAYVTGDIVAIESVPVEPSWTLSGPDKYSIDDIAQPGPTWSRTVDASLYPPRIAQRVKGLGWQADPYAR